MRIVKTLLIISLINFSSSTNIECLYRPDNWTVSGNVYVCDNQNNLNIISPETAIITSSSGIHLNKSNNAKVTAYLADSRHIEYFPRGLEKIYENLIAFFIQKCELKIIQQSDLKVFPKLIELNLGHNSIDVLEDDLFSLNPKIRYLFLSGNKFIHIGMKVFESLTSLSYLFLKDSGCIDGSAMNNTASVITVIKATKTECYNSDYDTFYNQISKPQSTVICDNSPYRKQLQKYNESKFYESAFFVTTLTNFMENEYNLCISDRLFTIEKLMIVKTLQNNQSSITQIYKNVDEGYINAEITKKMLEYDQKMESIEKWNSSCQQRVEKLENMLIQLSIRMVLIGVSSLLVIYTIAIGVCKVM